MDGRLGQPLPTLVNEYRKEWFIRERAGIPSFLPFVHSQPPGRPSPRVIECRSEDILSVVDGGPGALLAKCLVVALAMPIKCLYTQMSHILLSS